MDKNSTKIQWLKSVDNCIAEGSTGSFVAYDDNKDSILLEWVRVAPQSKEFSKTITSVQDILIQSYAQVELDFSKKCPEKVSTDWFLQSLTPLFKDGVEAVDWVKVERKIIDIVKNFYKTRDFAKDTKPEERHIFIIAKDALTDTKLGVIHFLISPNFAIGNIRVCYYGVLPAEQNRGIEKLLMSSIFTLLQNIERVFLHARDTNQQCLDLYKSWGFTQFSGKLPGWVDLEYIVSRNSLLQESVNKRLQ